MTTPDSGPITLRGHHLICLQFLHGGGYSVEFARNIMHLRAQFERAGALIGVGHDMVCDSCPRRAGQTCMLCPDSEDHVDDLDRLACDLLHVRPGESIRATELLDRVSVVLPLWRERACASCTWAKMCAASIDLLSRT